MTTKTKTTKAGDKLAAMLAWARGLLTADDQAQIAQEVQKETVGLLQERQAFYMRQLDREGQKDLGTVGGRYWHSHAHTLVYSDLADRSLSRALLLASLTNDEVQVILDAMAAAKAGEFDQAGAGKRITVARALRVILALGIQP